MAFDSLHLYFTDATGTHTETYTKRRVTKEPTSRSSTGSEMSTRATRAQSGMETESETSTALRATRAQSGMEPEREMSTALRATRAQSGMEPEREMSTALRATRAQSSEYLYSLASTGRLT